jgi:hypothetical protein
MQQKPANDTTKPKTKDEMAAAIKSKFIEFVGAGMAPNEAAAKAIAEMSQQHNGERNVPVAPLNGLFVSRTLAEVQTLPNKLVEDFVASNSSAALSNLLSTAIKYVENAQREPWNPKFRSFKLSNAVADRNITSMPGGLELLLSVLCSNMLKMGAIEDDFVVYIPLVTDLDLLRATLADWQQKG